MKKELKTSVEKLQEIYKILFDRYIRTRDDRDKEIYRILLCLVDERITMLAFKQWEKEGKK